MRLRPSPMMLPPVGPRRERELEEEGGTRPAETTAEGHAEVHSTSAERDESEEIEREEDSEAEQRETGCTDERDVPVEGGVQVGHLGSSACLCFCPCP